MNTCNAGYNCSYKTVSGTFIGCKYTGFCDYKCPKDSRETFIPKCTCTSAITSAININSTCSICGKARY